MIHNELAFEDPSSAREFLESNSSGFFVNPTVPDPLKLLDCKPAGPKLIEVLEEKYRKVNIRGAI
jgi:hypothetical protein